MVVYKAMCDLPWRLWGLIQHANDNPADDFRAYAVNRFERCKRLMASPGFARHLAAVAARRAHVPARSRRELVRDGRHVTFQMAEAAVPGGLFAENPRSRSTACGQDSRGMSNGSLEFGRLTGEARPE